WKNRLEQITKISIWQSGFNQDADERVYVHRLAIKHYANRILDRLCQRGAFSFNRVTFLDNHLQNEPAGDAGGPSREFFSSFCKSLFVGEPAQILGIDRGAKIPLRKLDDAEQAEALTNLGKLIDFFYMSNGPDHRRGDRQAMGRVLPPSFFTILDALFKNREAPLSEDFIIETAKALSDNSNNWIWQILSDEEPITDEQKAFVTDILYLDVEEGDYSQALREYVLDQYRGYIEAAQIVANGIRRPTQYAIRARGVGPEVWSSDILGKPYDKEAIANLVQMPSQYDNPEVFQKATWLREFIREKDEVWIKRLLQFVTGSEAITAQTEISPSDLNLDVGTPDEEKESATQKEKFLYNLEFSILNGQDFSNY
ncbi:MAG: hypothetical protein HYZ48_01095, partial [Chlamydiales bacterium]|nr:hypothetical protein [Chlamydiales bacterium]